MKKHCGKLIFVALIALSMIGTAYAETAPKVRGSQPSAKAYERASDKANFKRTTDTKDKAAKKAVKRQEKSKGMTAKKDIKAQDKAAGKKAGGAAQGKKKGFLWW